MDISEYAAIWALIYTLKQHVTWINDTYRGMEMWWNMKLLGCFTQLLPYDMFVICESLLC